MVTSDSLAAESIRGGGQFADGESTYSSQPSRSTNTNTTDTSGAVKLDAAGQRQDRLTDTDLAGTNYKTPAQEPGMSKFGDAQSRLPGDGTYDTSKGGPQESYGGTAPSYVQGGRGGFSDGSSRPGGAGREGGFDSDSMPNASFGADVGGKYDPGRVAEQTFSERNARPGADAGYAADYSGGKGGFENLDEERA